MRELTSLARVSVGLWGIGWSCRIRRALREPTSLAGIGWPGGVSAGLARIGGPSRNRQDLQEFASLAGYLLALRISAGLAGTGGTCGVSASLARIGWPRHRPALGYRLASRESAGLGALPWRPPHSRACSLQIFFQTLSPRKPGTFLPEQP